MNMERTLKGSNTALQRQGIKQQLFGNRSWPIYLMILPGVLYFLVFRYIPMGGLVLAFKDYDPITGFADSPWVGLANFKELFTDADFWMIMRNTFLLSAINLFLFFPIPIVVALLLNEVRKPWVKKIVQTTIYIPHFVSWVVVAGITVLLFATQDGGINMFLAQHGVARFELLTDPSYFRALFLSQNVWKEMGWNSILFLAALASVDPGLYEAAHVDGAGRWRQMWHITLPSLRNIAVVLFILRIGHVMDVGFEQILLLQNPLNIAVSDVFDTFVYRNGVQQGEFSYSTAVGLFKSVVGLVLVMTFNRLAKKFGEEGVY
ncbi:ABC transporter permease [Paenibacillus sp. GCM10023248]|uniref:ABC transporter permease n=1 Tax=Bacillales TaxID=1385 RepID=UPI002378FF6C|nr:MULTISPECIES: ABC transporter permease subunit [Bacillales]MDD9269720.1 ABC transporter permease subunit [Paenibacillus sp. MAHUQ-63]MDR6881868.1 putative aldouronate transport system permease protein [Bacillus sp. 3255]